MLSLSTPDARAATVTAAELKAAFVFNFAKFTVWPEDALPASAPLHLCVMGDPAVLHALERTVKPREIEGHRVVVRKMDADGPIRSCHVLYAGGLVTKRAIELLESVKGVAVLTVSDLPAFTRLGRDGAPVRRGRTDAVRGERRLGAALQAPSELAAAEPGNAGQGRSQCSAALRPGSRTSRWRAS